MVGKICSRYEDYSKPLDVDWLYIKCNKSVHYDKE